MDKKSTAAEQHSTAARHHDSAAQSHREAGDQDHCLRARWRIEAPMTGSGAGRRRLSA